MVHRTDTETLSAHVHQFTQGGATVYTDERRLLWTQSPPFHRLSWQVALDPDLSGRQWATDADADGIREVHTNTIEGIWTTVGNFIRPFRGVHKKFLADYIALCECRINSKVITAAFISELVACTNF